MPTRKPGIFPVNVAVEFLLQTLLTPHTTIQLTDLALKKLGLPTNKGTKVRNRMNSAIRQALGRWHLFRQEGNVISLRPEGELLAKERGYRRQSLTTLQPADSQAGHPIMHDLFDDAPNDIEALSFIDLSKQLTQASMAVHGHHMHSLVLGIDTSTLRRQLTAGVQQIRNILEGKLIG